MRRKLLVNDRKNLAQPASQTEALAITPSKGGFVQHSVQEKATLQNPLCVRLHPGLPV